jgi:molecular chaperone HscB
MTNPFELLGAKQGFDLDLSVLEKRHREISRALHPDKHAQASASERRAALEKAAAVNEAWRILRDPVRRAEALFRLAGIAVGETNEPKATPDFLMEVMEQREALAEARAAKNMTKVEELAAEMKARAREAEAKLAKGFANGGAKEPLLPLLGELRYYKRFLEEVRAIEEEAEEAS